MSILDTICKSYFDLEDELKRQQSLREGSILCLEMTKLGLQAGTVALGYLTVTQPMPNSLPYLFSAYLCLEGSMIAANAKRIHENIPLFLMANLNHSVHKNLLLRNAPLIRTIYDFSEKISSP